LLMQPDDTSIFNNVSYQSTEPPSVPPQRKRRRMETAASHAVQPIEPPWQGKFRKSRWFTRGWTLLEKACH
jgi:hypothetical protein